MWGSGAPTQYPHMNARGSSACSRYPRACIYCCSQLGAPALAAFAAPLQDEVRGAAFSDTLREVWSDFRSTFFAGRCQPFSRPIMARL